LQVIPLTNAPNQSFRSTVNVNGNNIALGFFLSYNELAGYWSMRITDVNTNLVLVDNLPMVMDDSFITNILEQYGYLKIGNAYLVKMAQAVSDSPNEDNLGTTFQLVWGDNT
jgi:hypothetical protein